MSALGKTIRIYLADGSPTGIRHAELMNWTGQAIACPRGRIGEIAQWPESQRPGVYLLFGQDENTGKPLAYIGEAENVLTRLQNHVKNKEFWDQVIFITSKDENLTKAHVKYLESHMVKIAKRAGRVALENGNVPQAPALPRSERDAMEEFLIHAGTLVGSLGFSILQPLPKKTDGPKGKVSDPKSVSDVRLYLSSPKRKVKAEGASLDEGFIVYEGSVAAKDTLSSLTQGWVTLRDELVADGAFVADGDTLRLSRDTLFKSPSAAASIFGGSIWGGRSAWKTKSGETLKDLEERLAGDTTSSDESKPS